MISHARQTRLHFLQQGSAGCHEGTSLETQAGRETTLKVLGCAKGPCGTERKNPVHQMRLKLITFAISEESKKNRASQMVHNAIRSGALRPQPCCVCGAVRAIAHHEDYDKPNVIAWLCKQCHLQRHKELGWGLSSTVALWLLNAPERKKREALKLSRASKNKLLFLKQEKRGVHTCAYRKCGVKFKPKSRQGFQVFHTRRCWILASREAKA